MRHALTPPVFRAWADSRETQWIPASPRWRTRPHRLGPGWRSTVSVAALLEATRRTALTLAIALALVAALAVIWAPRLPSSSLCVNPPGTHARTARARMRATRRLRLSEASSPVHRRPAKLALA